MIISNRAVVLRILCLAAASLFGVLVSATASAAEEADSAHRLAMQRLAPLVGTFNVTGVRHGQDGKTQLKPSKVVVDYILNGFGVRDFSEADMGMEKPVALETTFSYDPYRNVYRVSVLDDTFGLMDIYEGRFLEDGILAVSNLRSDTYFPIGADGERLHFMLRWDMTDATKQFDVLMTSDGGASWAPYFEMDYSPVGK